MKKIIVFFATVLLTACVYAQAPNKMSYQAVIHNNSDVILTNTRVGIQISLLHGSETGTAVYVETQTPTTNVNGLVSIEIGTGALVSGDFSTIDWSSGPYYIKTEIDPTGDTSYSITGTNQLLSVPYALYATTAGSKTEASGHYVGELYGGGVVFWVDNTGQHGLIISMVDLSQSQAWSNVAHTLISLSDGWDGPSNTTAIIGQSAHISSAAKLCADYTNANYGTDRYSDWYLPTIVELNHVWSNFDGVQNALTNDGNSATSSLVETGYWSSSECDANNYGWYFDFRNGTTNYNVKSKTYYVRAVRTF